MSTFLKLIKSQTTEKGSVLQSNGQYTFIVRKDATKAEIKKAIEEVYGAKVKAVRMLIAPAKKRLMARGRVLTKRAVAKKAIVTLKDKKTIDPLKFKEAKTSK